MQEAYSLYLLGLFVELGFFYGKYVDSSFITRAAEKCRIQAEVDAVKKKNGNCPFICKIISNTHNTSH